MKYQVCTVVALFATSAIADVITVNDDGGADFLTIQAAIDFAVDGDEIWVSPGTYVSDGVAVVNMLGKDVRLTSTFGAELTIIDGEGVRQCVVCTNGESLDSVIDGFTIAHGYSEEHGGGIVVADSDSSFSNCIITGSYSPFGGGMYVADGWVYVNSCTFTANVAGYRGGGSYVTNDGNTIVTFSDCVFENNAAGLAKESNGGSGGGVSIGSNQSTVLMIDCSFDGNRSSSGGAIQNSGKLTATNCSFSNNSVPYDLGAGIRSGGAIESSPVPPAVGSLALMGCTFDSNSAVDGIAGYPTGGAVVIRDHCATTITDCTFSENSARVGGAIYSDTPYDGISVANCDFTENVAGFQGGAVLIAGTGPTSESALSFADCNFTLNQSGGGGAMRIFRSNFTVTDCFFSQNIATGIGSASEYAGGAVCLQLSNGLFTNCDFWNNEAPEGGGVQVEPYPGFLVQFDECGFVGNRAVATDGGAVEHGCYNYPESPCDPKTNVNFTDCVFNENSAARNGGAIATDVSSSLEVVASSFLTNTAGDGGGSIKVNGGGDVLVRECDFTGSGDTDAEYGGAIDCIGADAVLEIHDSVISGCSASSQGGGVAAYGASMLVRGCTISENYAPTGGGLASDTVTTVIEDTVVCGNAVDQVWGPHTDDGSNSIHEICCIGDINHDNVVDGADLTLLLGDWGDCPDWGVPCPGDLNGDDVVDGTDLALLLGGWGLCPR